MQNEHGRRKYIFQKYLYYQVYQGATKNSYCCTEVDSVWKCKVRISSYWNGRVETNGKKHEHDHPGDQMKIISFRRDLRNEATETDRIPHDILNRVSRK